MKRYKEILIKNINEMLKEIKEKKENGSFSELLFDGFSMQSINIKMGTILEKTWNMFLQTIDGVEILNIRMIAGSQIDILFTYKNVTYYFESKNNINLDTEKSIATYNKIIKIEKELLKNYDNVVSKILVNRYADTNSMKYFKAPITKEILFGYKDMFNIFNIEVTKEDWENLFSEIGNYIFKTLKEKK